MTEKGKISIMEKEKSRKPKEMKRIPVKFYSHKYILENEVTVNPMGEIAGFQVRPGMFDVNGALHWQMVLFYSAYA